MNPDCGRPWDIAAQWGDQQVLMELKKQEQQENNVDPPAQIKYLTSSYWDTSLSKTLAFYGHGRTLQWAYSQKCPCAWGDTFANAAQMGHLSILEWLYGINCNAHEDTNRSTNSSDNNSQDPTRKVSSWYYPWGVETCRNAAASGHLFILQWLRQRQCPWNKDTCTQASVHGHLHILQWARQSNGIHMADSASPDICPWNLRDVCLQAALHGHLHILQWIIQYHQQQKIQRQEIIIEKESVFRFDDQVVKWAIRGGHVHVVQWLANFQFTDLHGGIPLTTHTFTSMDTGNVKSVYRWKNIHELCKEAIQKNHFPILQWLYDHSTYHYYHQQEQKEEEEEGKEGKERQVFLPHEEIQEHVETEKNQDHSSLLFDHELCIEAIKTGNINMIQFIHQLPHSPWNSQSCTDAVRMGHLDIVQWLRQEQCPWDEHTSLALDDFLDRIWIKKSKCQHGTNADIKNSTLLTDKEQYFALLQYLWNEKCPWKHSWTCNTIARAGYLEILQWLWVQIGRGDSDEPLSLQQPTFKCLWDDQTFNIAARGGHFEVLQWLHNHGCTWNDYTCREAARGGHLNILQWLRNEGCPWNGTLIHNVAQWSLRFSSTVEEERKMLNLLQWIEVIDKDSSESES